MFKWHSYLHVYTMNIRRKDQQQLVEAVIETPKGSRNKYIWDEQRRQIRLKKAMPLGYIFPFDFGMIPGTLAEDDDPIDLLLLMEEPLFPGVFLDCRIIGALKARQKQVTENRNDRLIAVVPTCPVYGEYHNVMQLPEGLRRAIVSFFESYNEVQGKLFTPLGWAEPEEALQLLHASRKG